MPKDSEFRSEFDSELTGALSFYPIEKIGRRSRIRTYDPLIKSQLLCQLSYAPTVAVR